MSTMVGTSLEARIPVRQRGPDRPGPGRSGPRRALSRHIMRAMLGASSRLVIRLDAWIATIPDTPPPPEPLSPTRARLR